MPKVRTRPPHQQPDWMDSLPPVLLDRVRLCARERQVPVEIPLMVGLASIAISAGPGIEIQSGNRRATRANLFVLLGVSSGIGKSEVFKDLLGPVFRFEEALHQWWDETPCVKARAGEELLKAKISGMRSEIRRLYSGGTMRLFEMLQRAERARMACEGYRTPPCLVADDSTSEALAQIMHRSYESIATVSADARYFLKRLGTPDTKEESFFLKGYSGDLALTNRVSRNAVRLRRPCLTTLLLTQRDAHAKFVERTLRNRSGLLPRFLHACIGHADTKLPLIDGRTIPRIQRDYAEMHQAILKAYRFERTSAIVEASKQARGYLQEIEQHCRATAMTDESIRGEVLRRRAEQAWRVSLCLHLARHGNTAALHPLELPDAQSAAAIVERFTQIPQI
ncbi:DUF3987 domain-containing protein [Thalassobacterium sedimentorum]|uniref:DUF3987 domain-containing protein n=1 Tax=Thalassobacterium sedimentorum TaxID=3041258 RepID=UPI0028124F18|nr:DUF3987 domain-containing protein [Coraliomargarita sp. SDUM461004]